MAQSNKRAHRTAEGSYQDADNLEQRATDPESKDDPRWLRRMAQKVRLVAKKKAKSIGHKQSQRRP